MFPGNENCQKRKKAQAELYPPPGRPPWAGSKIESGGVVGHQQWVVCEEQKWELKHCFFYLCPFFDRKRKYKWQDSSREGPYAPSPPSTAAALTLPREGQGGGDTKQLPRCCSLLSLKFWYFKETTPHFSNHHLWIPVELIRYFDFLPGWVSF